MRAHIIGYSCGHSLNECIVMSYYILPPVNHHQQAGLFSYYNCNDRLWLASQKANTNYITSQPVKCSECKNNKSIRLKLLLNVNLSASTQFMNMKLREFVCIVLLYLHANFWATLKSGQKFGQKAFHISSYCYCFCTDVKVEDITGDESLEHFSTLRGPEDLGNLGKCSVFIVTWYTSYCDCL